MSEYMIPIKTAIITFPFIALLFTLPFLIYQYRKHGYINYYRAFLLYTFLLYFIIAYYLIILPLPKTRDVLSLQKPGTQYTQLKPFKFVADILKETKVNLEKPSTYTRLFKERAFLQALFNGILLMPLGIYLSYYFNKNLKKTIIIAFCVSLFFELTQLSGLYGYYNRPYRLFDVDDLMLNSFGGCLGYMISPIFKRFLPNVSKLDDNIDLEGIPVGFIRRTLAFIFDWAIFAGLFIATNGYFKSYMFIIICYFVLIYFTNGKTFGKWLFRIKVKGKGEKLRFTEILIRYGSFYYVFAENYVLLVNNTFIRNIVSSPINYILFVRFTIINFEF